ncbi:putative transcriptional regulator, asnC family protein [Rhodobacteraceae bacterium HTCC2150]|nr:putative transcriptional regulator, asnC family protein [Rhodobacteraceae bacterium HTCC2150]
MKQVLDQTDHRILSALRKNARASLTELSGLLGITRATTKARLDRLTTTGVIRRFTIETGLQENDLVRAVMTVQLQGSMSRSVIRALRAVPEIQNLYSTNGAWDLVAEIQTENLQSFDRVLRQVREINGVLNSETSLLLDVA